MNQGQKELGARKRMRAFKLWSIVVAALFFGLLVVTQFLPGGRRSFSDWLPPLLFLLVVSVVTATILICAWVVIRPPSSPRKLKRLAIAFASLVILIAACYTIGVLKKWRALSPRLSLPGESVADTQVACASFAAGVQHEQRASDGRCFADRADG